MILNAVLTLLVSLVLISAVEALYRRSFEKIDVLPRTRVQAFAVQILVVAGFILLLWAMTGRVYLSASACAVFVLMLIGISMVKKRVLYEPLVLHDFALAGQALQYPGLYIAFVGYARFAALALFVLMVLAAFIHFEVPQLASLGAYAVVLGFAVATLLCTFFMSFRLRKQVGAYLGQPEKDIARYGFITSLCLYAVDLYTNPFREKIYMSAPPFVKTDSVAVKPHIILVQAESFVSPDRLIVGNVKDARSEDLMPYWSEFMASGHTGRFEVPAWGANTMRTEFGVLTGKTEDQLGMFRFNPLLGIQKNYCWSMAYFLQSQGYKTMALHPFKAGFFGRNKKYPRLGFDEFMDESYFQEAERRGPYVSDESLAEICFEQLTEETDPVFQFVITMETHGPWGKDRFRKNEGDRGWARPPYRFMGHDLGAYAYHLDGLDSLIGMFRERAQELDRPVVFGLYGDHQPALPLSMIKDGGIDNSTNYLIWANNDVPVFIPDNMLSYHEIGLRLLGISGLIKTDDPQVVGRAVQ